MTDAEDGAPGWSAIDAACRKLYPEQPNPPRWTPQVPPEPGGGDTLNGISVYRVAEPCWHWHFVTYGLSDLFGDQPAADPEGVSGNGFEFTFRLRDETAADPDATPPIWPLSLLDNVARLVVRSGHVFGAGHHLNARGPIKLDDPTLLRAIGFQLDPGLGVIDTPAGRVEFLQLVGLTEAEEQAGADWSMSGLLKMLAERYPLGITQLDRPDLMSDQEFAARIAAGAERDGSDTGAMFVGHLATSIAAEDVIIELGASAVPGLCRLLPMRIPHDRELFLMADETTVVLRPGLPHAVAQPGGVLVHMDEEYCHELVSTIIPQRGDYRCGELKYLVWRVVPSEIREAGGQVTQILG